MPPNVSHPELLSRSELASRQRERLRSLLNEVGTRNSFWRRKFHDAGFNPTSVQSLDDLQKLPLTTKNELAEDQAANPPYGTNLTDPLSDYCRMHQTSGTTTGSPLRWLDTAASWLWMMECWAQIYRLIGLRREDRLCFPFSFGPFLGFWAGFEGANHLGNLCLAAGGMSSEARLRLILENAVTLVGCTPTYALRLAEVASAQGLNLVESPVRALLVAGEPGGGIPATRQRIEAAWGARVFDHWGMTELGPLAVECVEAPGHLHILETECIAEILHPQTNQPVPPGEQGELVITNLGRIGSPLIRYRTGDLVQSSPRKCPCGRSLLRLDGGILGRADDMLTIRGNNVFPSSLEAILRQFEEIAEYRIVVSTRRAMQHVRIEIEPNEGILSNGAAAIAATGAFLDTDVLPSETPELVRRVAKAIKDRLNFQAEIIVVPPGTLPRFEMKGQRFVRE